MGMKRAMKREFTRSSRWLLAVWLCLAGCEPAREPNRPTVSLRIRGKPPAATVIIDCEPLGSLEFVAAHGVALPPGVHHVTVQAVGYFPWDREVLAIVGSAPIALEVALTPIPD